MNSSSTKNRRKPAASLWHVLNLDYSTCAAEAKPPEKKNQFQLFEVRINMFFFPHRIIPGHSEICFKFSLSVSIQQICPELP